MTQTRDETIRTLRIVYVGLVAGIVVFLGIAAVLKDTFAGGELSERTPLLLGVLAIFAVGCIAAYTLIERATVAGAARGRLEPQRPGESSDAVLGAYRQLAIVGAGLIDGVSFFAAVIYVLTGSSITLGAACLGVALLVSRIPSRERLDRFAERTREGS